MGQGLACGKTRIPDCGPEVYWLRAMGGDQAVRKVLSFAAVDAGLVIQPVIYRKPKLRLLSGTTPSAADLRFWQVAQR